MKLLLMSLSFFAAAGAALAAEPAARAVVTVEPGKVVGPIKPMNATNNGPSVPPVNGDQKCGNFAEFCQMRIPYARIHDAIGIVSGGAHCADVSAIFPDFDADENDPKNYDFVFTDWYLDAVRKAGIEIFFQLGETIEHGPRKYTVLPPKDFAKWARICEHIIMHYNEGWGWNVHTERTCRNLQWSDRFNIKYCEIWNEPDLDYYDDVTKNLTPRCWGGTVTNFFELYDVSSKYLKKRFPGMKIGGPALADSEEFADRFLRWTRDHGDPLDFYSWHLYARTPEKFVEKCRTMRRLLDKYGYKKTESILNEWNYVKGWGDDYVYSRRCMSGDQVLFGAAFVSAVMSRCQDAPLDMLMYYDAQPSVFNGMFDLVTKWPMKGYYPFYAWAKLREDYGTQVACAVRDVENDDVIAVTGYVEKKDKAVTGGFCAVAAKDAKGRLAVFVTRFSDDRNVTDTGTIVLRIPGRRIEKGFAHVTDLVRSYTEVPLIPQTDGSAILAMQPLSFALIEL